MAKKLLPSRESLHQLLEYDPETGCLFWKERPTAMFKSVADARKWNARFCGREAGSVSDAGYVSIRLGAKNFRAHIVAWVMAYGELPAGDIDHINGVRCDNALANLRCVSRSLNAKNSRISIKNKTGIPGVVWRPDMGKWQADVRDNVGTRLHLGSFDTLENASLARKSAEGMYGYHPNHGRPA